MDLKKDLLKIKEESEKKYLLCYNNGKRNIETTRLVNDRINKLWNDDYLIESDIKKSFIHYMEKGIDVDEIRMKLLVGTIYNVKDEESNNIELANNFVHVYTYDTSCTSNNETFTDENYNKYRMSYQFFIKYEDLLKSCKKNNLNYNGPKTFKELEEKIRNGEIFDISLSLELKNQQEEQIDKLIEPQKEKQTFKDKIKRFI